MCHLGHLDILGSQIETWFIFYQNNNINVKRIFLQFAKLRHGYVLIWFKIDSINNFSCSYIKKNYLSIPILRALLINSLVKIDFSNKNDKIFILFWIDYS